jgi:hypothetical protein
VPDLLPDGAELTASFPYSRHRFPKFLVRDVQVALRLLDVGVAEHQLYRADVHSIAQPFCLQIFRTAIQISLARLGLKPLCVIRAGD